MTFWPCLFTAIVFNVFFYIEVYFYEMSQLKPIWGDVAYVTLSTIY